MREAIIDGVRLGAPMKFVLKAARVSPQAFAQWERQAQLPDAPVELVELFARIDEATGKRVLVNVGLLQSAAQDPKQWRAAAWWLERMHPDDFRKPEGAAVPQQTTLVVASSEDIKRLQATLAGRVIDASVSTPALGAGDGFTDEADADDGWDEGDD